jgi:hypothetical protein
MKIKSFDVNFPIQKKCTCDTISVRELNLEYKKITVTPLSQTELASDWSLVLPRKKNTKIIVEKNGHNFIKNMNNLIYFKINLSKLPNELWCKLKPVYEENILSYYIVKDRIFYYIVNSTVVDRDIIELREIINSNWYNKKDRIIELLHSLEDNEINGWIVIKAKKLIRDYIQVL